MVHVLIYYYFIIKMQSLLGVNVFNMLYSPVFISLQVLLARSSYRVDIMNLDMVMVMVIES